jgi:hypothetical protein
MSDDVKLRPETHLPATNSRYGGRPRRPCVPRHSASATPGVAGERGWRLGCRACLLLAFAAISAPADPVYPGWWIARGVVSTNAAVTNDYAAVNQGQLRWMAAKAAEELDTNLRNGAGASVTGMVAGFTSEHAYVGVNQGQVKHVATPIYERLIAEGCAAGLPWTAQLDDDASFAAVNAGQLKQVFAFDLDPDGDGLPDWWEQENGGADGVAASADCDGDGLMARQEYERRTDPLGMDSDGDGVADSLDASPMSAADTDGDGVADDWEVFWFGGLGRDGAGDADGDGRLDIAEYRECTDPTRADRVDAENQAALSVFRPGKDRP